MYTSFHLVVGEVYTRKALRELFGITDKTVDTGIFRPKGHDSVWIFITEAKSADMTLYVDHLHGDVLEWQGQTAGRKDKLIIDHKYAGVELVVFYRGTKREYPGSGFLYLGTFEYVSHRGSHPTTFLLHRFQPRLVAEGS